MDRRQRAKGPDQEQQVAGDGAADQQQVLERIAHRQRRTRLGLI